MDRSDLRVIDTATTEEIVRGFIKAREAELVRLRILAEAVLKEADHSAVWDTGELAEQGWREVRMGSKDHIVRDAYATTDLLFRGLLQEVSGTILTTIGGADAPEGGSE